MLCTGTPHSRNRLFEVELAVCMRFEGLLHRTGPRGAWLLDRAYIRKTSCDKTKSKEHRVSCCFSGAFTLRMKNTFFGILPLICGFAACAAVQLNKENLADVAKNRPAFIKFFAPWCGHCKALAPAWDALTEDFKDSDSLFVSECDCTAGCKDLCSHVGVQGYPTLKYGDVNSLQDYKGGRDLESMKKHAETIKPACSPSRRESCSAQELEQLDELLSKSRDQLLEMIKEQEAVIATAEKEFETSVKSLQDTYTNILNLKEEKIKQVQASGLQLMKSVLSTNNK